MPELIIQTGKHRGKKLVLPESEILIGRDETCHIRLASSDVSRQHCRLKPVPGGFTVIDLQSRNGTFVNEMNVEGEILLGPGDRLQIGPMVFQIPEAPPAPAPEAEAAPEVSARGRKRSARRRPAAATEAQATSDEDIVAWLGEDDSSFAGGTSDTTIISALPTPGEPSPASQSAPSQPAAPAPSPPVRTEFASVAEEAADIIRRHREAQREGQSS